MSTYAVVLTGGKQYLVTEGQKITVEHINQEVGNNVELSMLAKFDESGEKLELGAPEMKQKAAVKVVEQGKGEKVRISKFKSKTRYRRAQGFRPTLTTVEVVSI